MVGMADVPSLASGALTRRDADGWLPRLADWMAESRTHRVIVLVLAIWLLNGFDLVFTILAYQQGLLHEENPVARQLLRQGPWSISFYKIAMVLIGSYPLLRFRAARITELGALVVLIAYATLAVHWSTVYEIYALTGSSGLTIAELDRLTGVKTY